MIIELILVLEDLLSKSTNEIVSITVILVGINFAVNGGFKLFKKPPKVLVCPHAEEE